MGLWSFLFRGKAANVDQNTVSPPSVVIENPDYVVKDIKPKGANSWQVWIGSKNDTGTGVPFTVSRRISSFSGNHGTAKVYWA